MLQRSENPPWRALPYTNGTLPTCATTCPSRTVVPPSHGPQSPSHRLTESPSHAPGATGRTPSAAADQCLDPQAIGPTSQDPPLPRDEANRLLSAYYTQSLPNLIDVATALNLTALDLLELIERDDIKGFIARLDAAEEARAKSLAIHNRSAGVGGLTTIVEAGAIDSSRDRETLRLAASGILRASATPSPRGGGCRGSAAAGEGHPRRSNREALPRRLAPTPSTPATTNSSTPRSRNAHSHANGSRFRSPTGIESEHGSGLPSSPVHFLDGSDHTETHSPDARASGNPGAPGPASRANASPTTQALDSSLLSTDANKCEIACAAPDTS